MKDIVGWEGLYGITEDGKVYSYRRKKFIASCRASRKSKMNMVPSIHLYKNGQLYNYIIARLLAMAYIPNPNNYPQINHKDGNPKNNTLDNLEWCTQSQNIKHAYANGLMKPQRGRRKNTKGEPNIHKTKEGKWVVQVWHKSKAYSGGTFTFLEDAILRRDLMIARFELMN